MPPFTTAHVPTDHVTNDDSLHSPNKPPCPVCSGTRLYYLFSVGIDRVVRCNDCGLLISHEDVPVSAQPTVNSPAAADVMLHVTRQRGQPTGSLWCYESSDPAIAAHASRAGYEVTTGSDISAVDSSVFDVVILGDGLNRTTEPARLLAAAHRVLRPDGTLAAWTPALADWCGGALPGRTNHEKAAGCYYFNSATLQSVLFLGSFRHLAVRATSAARPSKDNDAGCLVLAQRAPVRPRPLLSVVVAIYNEAATAGESLDKITSKRLAGLDSEIIIVESNSNDGTRAIVERYATKPGVRVIYEDRPRGKGRAVREGLKHANGDFVLIQDADLEYDLEDYEMLLEPLVAGREAFVLGARHGGQTWKIRRFSDQPAQAMLMNLAHRGFTALINVSLGLTLSDPFTMYKVFRRDCLHGLTFECNRFDFDWELLIKLVRKGYRPIEIPVNYRSRSFKEGKKVRMIRDPLTWIWAWARSRFGPLER